MSDKNMEDIKNQNRENARSLQQMAKRKLCAGVALEIVGAALLALVIAWLHPAISANSFKANFDSKLDLSENLVCEAQENANIVYERYDNLYASMANTAAFYMRNKEGFSNTHADVQEIFNRIDANALRVEDSSGRVLVSCAKDGYSSATSPSTSSATGANNSATSVATQSQGVRTYSAKIDDNKTVYVEKSTDEIEENVNKLASISAELDDVAVGQTGFVVAVDSTGCVAAHKQESLIGKSAQEIGITSDNLKDGFEGDIYMNGEWYMCKTRVCDNYTLVCALPYDELNSFTSIYVGLGVVIYLIAASILLAFVYFCATDRKRRERQGESSSAATSKAAAFANGAANAAKADTSTTAAETSDSANTTASNAEVSPAAPRANQNARPLYKKFGAFARNLDVGAKAIPVCVGCLLFVAVASMYLTTLVELSSTMVSNTTHAKAAAADLSAAEKTKDAIDTQATANTETKAKLVAYMLPQFSSAQLTRSFMIDLREALDCDGVWFYNIDGSVKATDNDFWGYTLSEDPTSFSYQFREILEGRKSEVVAESQDDNADWNQTKYIALATQDANYRTTGLVEVGSNLELVNKMKSTLSASSVLGSVQPGNNAFAFTIDAKSGAFTYYPDSNLVGRAASDAGVALDCQKAGFSDFLTIGGQTYLCASVTSGSNYLYIATPASAIFNLALPNMLIYVVFCALWFFVMLAFMVLRTQMRARAINAEVAAGSAAGVAGDECKSGAGAGGASAPLSTPPAVPAQVTSVSVGGRVKQTTAAASRFNMRGLSWANRTPGQKVLAASRIIFTCLALVLLVLFLFADSLFSADSLFRYILDGSWQPGLNLFAITRCVVVVFVAYSLVDIVRRLLQWFAQSMTAKGETICRLLDNVLKFAFAIVIIFFCLGTLGVNTTVLLTSAGILTLVVGLGAKELITDILAGLFIVFEGEFQVGDIVTIGDFRGEVQEIGVRTTKVKGGDNNVKVFANRNVTGVVNMTKDLSSVACSFDFPETMSLERMEAALARELPNLNKELPAIVSGPFYRGVTEIGDKVKLQIVAKCKEADRRQLERDLNREIRLIMERYLLGPEAQANEVERVIAEKFSDEQAAASKDIHLDSDN